MASTRLQETFLTCQSARLDNKRCQRPLGLANGAGHGVCVDVWAWGTQVTSTMTNKTYTAHTPPDLLPSNEKSTHALSTPRFACTGQRRSISAVDRQQTAHCGRCQWTSDQLSCPQALPAASYWVPIRTSLFLAFTQRVKTNEK